MVELIATVAITVSSVLLFGYWFRYTCMLILTANTARDYAGEVAIANQLGFLGVQAALRGGIPDLDRLRSTLDRDYAVLSRMLKSSQEEFPMENRMLGIHYRVMSVVYQVGGRFSTSAARQALDEMSMVVARLANGMGEQMALGASAA